MTQWGLLNDAKKLAHNEETKKALHVYEMLANQVNANGAWLGKNGPPAAPFGRETVESRNIASTAKAAHEAYFEYKTLLTKYRAD